MLFFILPFVLPELQLFKEALDPDNSLLIFPLSTFQHLQKNPEHLKLFEREHTLNNIQVQEQMQSQIKNICLNFKNPKSLTQTQKLQEFKKSACSPVILVPGILGTKLIVEIDCQTLQSKRPDIFQNCGWSNCKGYFGVPQQSYILWINLQILLKDIKVIGSQKKCFGDLMQLIINTDPDVEDKDRYKMPEGIKVTWFGNSIHSFQYSECGSKAIGNLAGDSSLLQMMTSQCAINGYSNLIQIMKNMGYILGVTLQPLPYDFRYGINDGITGKIIPQVIKNLYSLTGKKVIITAHSLGSLHSLSSLAFHMDLQQKNKMVRHFIPIGPPFTGDASAIRNAISMDSSFYKTIELSDYLSIGINFYSQKKFVRTSGSTADLYVKNVFEMDKQEDWIKDVIGRIKYQKDQSKQNPIQWFPSKQQNCYDPVFELEYKCQMFLINLKQQPIIKIENEQFYSTPEDIKRLFRLTIPNPESLIYIYDRTKLKGYDLSILPQPQVNVTVLYSSYYKTKINYQYDHNPIQEGKNDQFTQNITSQYSYGDNTVPSFSALLPPIRWISKGNKGHSVKVVQICGNSKVKNNHFETITCNCVEDQFANQITCTHACLISDIYVIKYLLKHYTNNGKGYQEDTSNAIKVNDLFLTTMNSFCPNLQLDFDISKANMSNVHEEMKHYYRKNEQVKKKPKRFKKKNQKYDNNTSG